MPRKRFTYLIRFTAGADWADLSLSAAMRGMEEEQSPYTLDDIEETFS